ncbi:MAG: hypothetical protein IPK83_11765 [Planctomycetes bacterium]|nr:hypothetical protein [Planctomycetota bacterium]
MNDAILRFVPHHEQRGTLAAFVRRSFLLVAGIGCGSFLLMLLFARPLGRLLFMEWTTDSEAIDDAGSLMALSAMAIGLSIFYFYLLAVFRGLRMFGALSRLEISHAVFFLVGAIAMILTNHLTAYAIAVNFIISIFLPVLYYGGKLTGILRGWPGQSAPMQEAAWEFRLLRYSLWTMLAGVAWQALQYYSTWYLNKTHGAESVAVFGTVQKLAQLVLIGAVAVSTVAMTTVTKTWESLGRIAAERQLSLAFRGTGIALFFVCAMLALFRNVVMMAFRGDYAAGAESLPLQLLFSLLAGYLAFLPGYLNLREKTRHAFWAWAVGIGSNVLLAYWLTGARGRPVTQSDAWQSAERWLSLVIVPSFSDALGLHGAAWCAAVAMLIATMVCTLLVRAEGVAVDRGMIVVLVASLLLVTRPWILAGGTCLLLLAALRTNLVFSSDERSRISRYAIEAGRHIPFIHLIGILPSDTQDPRKP